MRGKAAKKAETLTDSGDHPRLCGEKLKPRRRIETNQGSPPPMRGKAWVESPLHDADRITPAYAGKSGAKNVGNRPSKDHPRLCGEKPASSSLVMFQPGSPPPMRGKACESHCTQHTVRITPAYAGKRSS